MTLFQDIRRIRLAAEASLASQLRMEEIAKANAADLHKIAEFLDCSPDDPVTGIGVEVGTPTAH